MLTDTDHMHLQRRSYGSYFCSNTAQAHLHEGCTANLTRARTLIPHGVSGPLAPFLVAHRGRHALGKSHDHGDCVLGHHRPVDASGVADDNITGNEFGRHEPVHCGSDGVNPAQACGCEQLLRPHGPADHNVSVREFLFVLSLVCGLSNLYLRKLGAYTRGKPRRWVPHIKLIMEHNHDLVAGCFVHAPTVGGRRILSGISPPSFGQSTVESISASDLRPVSAMARANSSRRMFITRSTPCAPPAARP